MNEFLMKKGVTYSIVISPNHPKMTNYSNQFYISLDSFIAKNKELNIYNFTQILDDNQFLDHAHPNAKGREQMTNELKKVIN